MDLDQDKLMAAPYVPDPLDSGTTYYDLDMDGNFKVVGRESNRDVFLTRKYLCNCINLNKRIK